jgi:hypothetical protein
MRILRQNITKSFEFFLYRKINTLGRFSAKLSKLEMKNGSRIVKKSS